MQLRRFIGTFFIGALCACSANSGQGKDAQPGPAAVPASQSSVSKKWNPAMESKNNLGKAAMDATSRSGGDVAFVEAVHPTAVVVRYLKGDAQSSPSSCAISIVEEAGGKEEIVETNNSMLGCSLASSADEVKAKTKVDIKKDQIRISGEGDNGNSEFELYRGSDGVWYVAKAGFTYPEEDSVSGDLIVINEAVSFGPGGKSLRFSDYSYDAIKGDLSRTSVE